MALDEVKKDKRTSYAIKRDFFDGEYPPEIIALIDRVCVQILKGDEEFKSVDIETANVISTIIRDNASLGVAKIAGLILDQVDDLSFKRAEIIAQTTVAETVEMTRQQLYTSDPVFKGGTKEWLTSVQDICEICKGNEEQGRISIDVQFQSGHTRPTAHPRCRCDVLYYAPGE